MLFRKKEEMRLFLNEYVSVKSIKSSDTNKFGSNNMYWVRLDDEKAYITVELCQNILKMIQTLKDKLEIFLKEASTSQEVIEL